jgi:LacI family transcriptional regulator
MKKSVTVIEVAKLAKVSPSTVSRHLRGGSISKKAAVRVENAIRTTGYTPDEAARTLRVGRSRTLGVLVPRVTNTFFGQAVQSMEELAHALGYSLMLFTHLDRPDEQALHLATMRRCRVDGVLLAATPGTTIEQIRSGLGETPVVAFDAFVAPEMDSVVLENRGAAKEATAHLAAHGYKRIAAVGAKGNIFSFRERIAGYSAFMKSRALSPLMIVGEDYDQLRHMLRTALNGKHPPEALLTLCDFATYNVIRVFEELHWGPKKWVPMLGFDEFPYAALLGVPISVIQQPVEEMARAGFSLLMRRIQEPAAKPVPECIRIPGELIRRRSCGCA